MTNRPLRLGFVTVFDASDRAQYSGISYCMREALRSQPDVTVFDIDRLSTPLLPAWRAKQALYRYGLGKSYSINRQPFVVRSYSAQARARCLALGDVDALLSPGSIPLALYAGPVPTFFWADATFAAMIDFYPQAKPLAAETIRNGNRLELAALTNCCKAVYSSDWAAKSAVDAYGAPADKVHVVPYGSNVDANYSEHEVRQLISGRQPKPLELLFIGVDSELLVARGHKVTLHVVGDSPPHKMPDCVVQHGFLSKKTNDGRERLDRLFRQSHLLLLPTKADCSPIVIPEAYAYGLPVIASDVGGISTSVKNGVTGRLLAPNSPPESWADAVLETCRSNEAYSECSLSAFRFYRAALDWGVATRRVVEVIRDTLGDIASSGVRRAASSI
jgi:hypothetical protein